MTKEKIKELEEEIRMLKHAVTRLNKKSFSRLEYAIEEDIDGHNLPYVCDEIDDRKDRYEFLKRLSDDLYGSVKKQMEFFKKLKTIKKG